MITNDDFTALIAVKGNSDRIKKKNIRKFSSSNLLEIKLNQLRKDNLFKNILVSSESAEVLEKCKKFKVKLHKRDPYYSTPHVPMSEVYEYLAKKIKTTYVAWIPVTSPLVDNKIYKKAIKTFIGMNFKLYDSLLSVHEIQEYIYHKKKPFNFKRIPHMRSQDLKKLYAVNFAINILSRKNMIKYKTTIGEKPKFFKIQKNLSIDIDEKEDFILAELLYNLKIRKKNES